MPRFHPVVLAAALGLAALAPAAFAGQIVAVTPFPGINSVAGTFIDPSPTGGNDNVVGDSPNDFWVTQKDYIAIGPVDLLFTVVDNAGTTEYRFREGVSNSTGITWTGYRVELGFGTGASFTPSTAGDGLDFDAPDFDSTVDFMPGLGWPTVTVLEDSIIASGATLAHLQFVGDLIFHIDVPNGITEFTLRQQPIPEPATALLLGLGAVAALRRRAR